ncbi:MAG: hypothetical protein JW969_20255 [Spirochaetales bacterium]|nr:hypothetical protein [Spirochaetales bacterium]
MKRCFIPLSVLTVLLIFSFSAGLLFAEHTEVINEYLKAYNWPSQDIEAYMKAVEKLSLPEFSAGDAVLLAKVLNLVHENNAAMKPEELALFSAETLHGTWKMKRLGISEENMVRGVMRCGRVFVRDIARWRVDTETNAVKNNISSLFQEEIKTAILMEMNVKQHNRYQTGREVDEDSLLTY